MSNFETTDTNESNGVPNTFTKMSENVAHFDIIKGTLNKFRIRPAILNEHAESSKEAMGVVNATTLIGQMFLPSQDNINGAMVTLESAAIYANLDSVVAGAGEKKAGTQEYSTDAALQAEWIKSGAVEAVRSAFTGAGGTTQTGSYAMKAPCDTTGDDWRVTITSTDLTGVTIHMDYANTKEWNKCKVSFFIGDGTNTKSYPMTISAKDVWQSYKISEASMTVTGTDDTATTPDITAITQFGFRVTDPDAGEFFYVDQISYQAEPGGINVELWKCGVTLPVADGATFDLTTNATQYTELGDRGIGGTVVASINLSLAGGKRNYFIQDFIAGVALENPSNTILTVGEYYALVLVYDDTDVTVYGPNTAFSTNYYASGYAFSATGASEALAKLDDITVIPGAAGAGAYSDIMFCIYSVQDAYVTEGEVKFDAVAGHDANFHMFVEDSGMVMTDMISINEQRFGDEHEEDLSGRPVLVPKGGKFEVYYNDDPTDDITDCVFEMRYKYIPPTVNG